MYWGGYEIIIAKGFFFVNTKDSQICQKHLLVFVYFQQIYCRNMENAAQTRRRLHLKYILYK